MSTLRGTGTLVRLILRRDRVRLAVWVGALLAALAGMVGSYADLYATPESRQARALLMELPIGIAFGGPRIGLDDYTFGAMLTNEVLGLLALVVGLMSVFLVVRNLRTEEELGRAELLRAGTVGRHAAIAASIGVVAVAQVLVVVLYALYLPTTPLDLDPAGAWLFSLAIGAVGVAFAGVAAVAAQVMSDARGALSLGSGLVIGSYVLRAIGDILDSGISLLSPIGLAQATRAFVDDTWWPVFVLVGIAIAGVAFAVGLASRRDVGAGLIHPRPGPRVAARRLGVPLGLAFRLQRGTVIAWAVGALLLAFSYGGIVGEVESLAEDNPVVVEMLEAVGGADLTESWVSFITLFMVVVVSTFAVQAVMRMRPEEVGQRAEHLLARGVARSRWASSHLGVAVIGSVVILAASAVIFGGLASAATGDQWVGASLLGALGHLPALAVVAGFAFALVAGFPRFAQLAWAAVAVVWVAIVGGMLGLPAWAQDLSPFSHTPALPADEVAVAPLLVLSALAAALVVAGYAGLRRRDFG